MPRYHTYIVGSEKPLVEASIFWMDRPGVEFELYSFRSVLPDSEITDGKSVFLQILGVRLQKLSAEDVSEGDWSVAFT